LEALLTTLRPQIVNAASMGGKEAATRAIIGIESSAGSP
jgi:hypothetical protein